MLIAAAWLENPSAKAPELASAVHTVLGTLGGKVSDGAAVLEGAAAVAFLRQNAEDFLARQLPILQSNGAL